MSSASVEQVAQFSARAEPLHSCREKPIGTTQFKRAASDCSLRLRLNAAQSHNNDQHLKTVSALSSVVDKGLTKHLRFKLTNASCRIDTLKNSAAEYRAMAAMGRHHLLEHKGILKNSDTSVGGTYYNIKPEIYEEAASTKEKTAAELESSSRKLNEIFGPDVNFFKKMVNIRAAMNLLNKIDDCLDRSSDTKKIDQGLEKSKSCVIL